MSPCWLWGTSVALIRKKIHAAYLMKEFWKQNRRRRGLAAVNCARALLAECALAGNLCPKIGYAK